MVTHTNLHRQFLLEQGVFVIIAVEFDENDDVYTALANAGLDHIADSVIYTNYYEIN